MSLTAIRAQLKTNLATITGVKVVYNPPPSIPPSFSELPAVIIDKSTPSLTTTHEAIAYVRYTHHVNVKFLFTAMGEDNYAQWMANLEKFYALFDAKINSDIKLSGAATFVADNHVYSEGVVNYLGTDYYGFDLTFDVIEKVSTPMA